MDTSDLRNIFALTGFATVAITGLAMLVSPDWAMRYGFLSPLALANWIALAATVAGISRRRPALAVWGLMAKPLLLTILLIYAIRVGIEITSFLAAMNTFFVCIFAYMAFQGGRNRMVRLAHGSEAHG